MTRPTAASPPAASRWSPASTITDSLVSDNAADTSSAVPTGVEQEATAGGIQIQGNASATIRSTTITGNSVRSTNTVGDALAFSGGLHADGPIVLSDSTVSDNSVVATTATGRADVDSGAGEINTDATISNTRFTGNSATATSSGDGTLPPGQSSRPHSRG